MQRESFLPSMHESRVEWLCGGAKQLILALFQARYSTTSIHHERDGHRVCTSGLWNLC